jgi:hypothetical protein
MMAQMECSICARVRADGLPCDCGHEWSVMFPVYDYDHERLLTEPPSWRIILKGLQRRTCV